MPLAVVTEIGSRCRIVGAIGLAAIGVVAALGRRGRDHRAVVDIVIAVMVVVVGIVIARPAVIGVAAANPESYSNAHARPESAMAMAMTAAPAALPVAASVARTSSDCAAANAR